MKNRLVVAGQDAEIAVKKTLLNGRHRRVKLKNGFNGNRLRQFEIDEIHAMRIVARKRLHDRQMREQILFPRNRADAPCRNVRRPRRIRKRLRRARLDDFLQPPI